MAMQFIDIREPGGPEQLVLASAPAPVPGPGELQIDVVAAGVNRPDIMQRQGLYPPPDDASPILGLEVAGYVSALGEGVDAWQVGDPVCALTPGGGYAQVVCAPAAHCLPPPAGYSLQEAAGSMETLFTVWHNVFERGALRAGETLLVHGGSSGIGTTAIQLARAWGAQVLATAGTERKCRACERLGARRGINYRSEDFVTVCRELTDDVGVDVILDMVGGSYVARNFKAAAADGRIVSIAVLEGARAEVNAALLMLKRLSWTGSTLRAQSVAAKAAIARNLLARVWPLLEQGAVRPVIDAVYPLREAAEAHRHLERGEHIGKVLLQVRD